MSETIRDPSAGEFTEEDYAAVDWWENQLNCEQRSQFLDPWVGWNGTPWERHLLLLRFYHRSRGECEYGGKGWPTCHCNICIDKNQEWKGLKKGDKFNYKGIPVEIKSFCPLPSCKEVFIQGIKEPGFCKWLMAEEIHHE